MPDEIRLRHRAGARDRAVRPRSGSGHLPADPGRPVGPGRGAAGRAPAAGQRHRPRRPHTAVRRRLGRQPGDGAPAPGAGRAGSGGRPQPARADPCRQLARRPGDDRPAAGPRRRGGHAGHRRRHAADPRLPERQFRNVPPPHRSRRRHPHAVQLPDHAPVLRRAQQQPGVLRLSPPGRGRGRRAGFSRPDAPGDRRPGRELRARAIPGRERLGSLPQGPASRPVVAPSCRRRRTRGRPRNPAAGRLETR